ncbi:MAG: GNAT family N-acetyltransferase [Eubacterium sp.]|nr:GNAT family N-acetyltransferase [Eubacterium sp.]
MELLTKNLILRILIADDLDEIARMWNYPVGVTNEEAAEILKGMQDNLKKNKSGAIYHLCLGVFEKNDPKHIIGWCGLDGTAAPGQTVMFYIIDEKFRNKGYATQCAVELLRYAFEDMGYESIHSGCARDNIASYRVMEKAGMRLISRTKHGGYNFEISKDVFLTDVESL